HPIFVSLSVIRPPPRPTLFPYTTLFRSDGGPPPDGAHPSRPHVRRRVRVAARQGRPGGDRPPRGRERLDADAARRSGAAAGADLDRKSTRLNSSHVKISYAVFCLKKKKK